MDTYLIIAIAIAAGLALWWLLSRRRRPPTETQIANDRLDTLAGWPPEATRILRTSERLALSTLRLALPGYMILAQVPVARFISVPKRNSYAEWMRRIGSQCDDNVVCDMTSQVVAVNDVRPPEAQISDRLRRRLERVARTLKQVGIPLHVWNDSTLPSVDAARASILPQLPPIPGRAETAHPAAATAGANRGLEHMRNAFADTDRDAAPDSDVEVIEMLEPSASTWFDELDSVPPSLPPDSAR
jgi:hypothetical protein